jgi:predicted small metal-binding protein
MKTISYREAGFECDYIVKGETEEDAIRNGAEHTINEHGMKPGHIIPETKEKIRALVRDV